MHLYASHAGGALANRKLGVEALVDTNGRGSFEVLGAAASPMHFKYQAGATFTEGGGKTVNLAASGSSKFGTDVNSDHYFSGSIEVGLGAINVLTHDNSANAYGIQLPNEDDYIGKAKAFAFDTYSSLRYKKNVATLEGALEKTKQLRGVTFDWKSSSRQDIGLIAEEVAPVLPECVSYEPDGTIDGVNYPKIVSLLIEAIKEQNRTIENLRTDVDELKSGS